ncbi:MAG TPA: 2,3-bisphosphoglycerate-independent phosphoglycerate mutase [Candidatus Paceibacterota bacterium]|nr:2,3-bisphosphoglycerate-independent phosphoglycerate mutase [Candidatus Paceibacterota bacterium]
MSKKQTALIILDGWGYREDATHNAVAEAKTPVFDALWKEYPHTLLEASGLAVGLPEGQMGNSEIGHTTIGAGKPIDTDLVRIAKAIKNGEFENNPSFIALFDHVKKHGSLLHAVGLLGDGGVHAHSEHLFAFLRAAKKHGIGTVALHLFTDGRDTPPQSAAGYLRDLEKVLAEIQIGFIATLSGRFFAMDRDNNWDRLAKAEKAIFHCEGNVCELKDMPASAHVEKLYKDGKLDEHIEPLVFTQEEEGAIGTSPLGRSSALSNGDAVFFFNFRPDRARMLSKKFLEKVSAHNVLFTTMTSYGSEYPSLVAFPSISIETTLGAEVSKAGLTQAHFAETEKFPHATYFLNGGREQPHEGEEHVLLASRKDVSTHDQAPEMRAEAIADEAIKRIEAGVDFIFINFANPDMVGHTANVPAIITAVETVDTQLGRVLDALHTRGGSAFVTADHGNAEVNIDAVTGEKHTAHTLNPVPAIITGLHPGAQVSSGGSLADIAPTVLSLLEIPTPTQMTGRNLVV